jgi:hypothetical protein
MRLMTLASPRHTSRSSMSANFAVPTHRRSISP